jgi:hypothetical protein
MVSTRGRPGRVNGANKENVRIKVNDRKTTPGGKSAAMPACALKIP